MLKGLKSLFIFKLLLTTIIFSFCFKIFFSNPSYAIAYSTQAGFEIEGNHNAPGFSSFIAELQPPWIRIHIRWSMMTDPATGYINWNSQEWTNLINALNTIRSSSPNTKVILTVKGTPPLHRHQAFPNLECWRTTTMGTYGLDSFARDMAAKLKPGNPYNYPVVEYFELWNEPDILAPVMALTPELSILFGCWIRENNETSIRDAGRYYAAQLQHFYEYVHFGNPDAKIVAGALATIGSNPPPDIGKFFLEGWLSTYNQNFDYLSVHKYNAVRDPHKRTWYVDNPNYAWDLDSVYHYLVRTLNGNGVSRDVKIIFSEIGLQCSYCPAGYSGDCNQWCHDNMFESFDSQQHDYIHEVDVWARSHARVAAWINYTLGRNGWLDTDLLTIDNQKKKSYQEFACITHGILCNHHAIQLLQ